MPKIHLQNNKTILTKNFISISKAAKFLQVSPDTLRNWEKAGKLLPARTHGGARRYSMAELMALKKEIHPVVSRKKGLVTVSAAALALQVSADTLRGWDKRGLIETSRTKGGARRFTRDEIKRLQDELGVEAKIPVKTPKFVPEVHNFSFPWFKVTFSMLLIALVLSSSWYFGSFIGPLEKKTDENSKLLSNMVKSIEDLQRGVLGVQTQAQPTPSPIAVPNKVEVVYVNRDNSGVAITYAEAPVVLDAEEGKVSCPSCLTSSTAYISAVNNSDGAISITLDDMVATVSLNLSHTNSWGANQNFKGGVGIGTESPSQLFQLNDSTANPVVMTVSGNVGIGITTPINKLEVAGGQTIGEGFAGNFTAPANGLLVQGNVGIGTSVTSNPLVVGVDGSVGNGAYLSAGGTWTNGSSRGFKENFAALDGQDILNKINKLDISEWNYKVEGPSVKHIGPVAEDFYAIFGVGNDPQHISTIDPAGIALAGIKAQSRQIGMLDEKTSSAQKEINDLLTQQASMSAMLAQLSFNSDGTLSVPQIRTSSLVLDSSLATASNLTANDNQLVLNTDPNYTSPGPSLASNDTSYIDFSGEIASLESRIQDSELRIKELESMIGNVGIGTTTISSTINSEAKNDSSSSANLTANDSPVQDLADITTQNSVQVTGDSGQQESSSSAASNCNLQPETCNLNLTPPDILFASSSAKLANLEAIDNLSSDKLFAVENSKISGDLSVFGKTILASTTIAGDLTVDGTLSISGNSMNVIGAPDCSADKTKCGILYLQSSSLAYAVDFFNGLVTIDKTGSLKAQTVTVAEFRVVANKISGSSKIAEGSKSADIENPLVKPSSRILITPTADTNLVLAVTEKVEDKKFTVSVAKPADKDIVFDWFLVNESD